MKKGIILIVIAVFISQLMAAPSLDVREPPVTDVWDWTGPIVDPDALNGQWFRDNTTFQEEFRTHEFYDNVEGSGGGTMSCFAIEGYVIMIQYQAGNIIAFDIEATITNDTPAYSEWADGSNSHDEFLSTQDQYEGTLWDTKLTAEFALNQFMQMPSMWTGPYRDRQEYIVAVNEDQEAWYCWTPDNPEPDLIPWGDYYVPTWDFGDIPPGMSSTRTLQFTCAGAGIPPADTRYNVIVNSYDFHEDVLLNRTTSLKISTWIDEIYTDICQPYPQYPEGPLRASDCSVFHNINPENPVELSSFTATYTTDGPTLGWVTQSEVDNIGWNVYRANTGNFDESDQINGNLIAGAGTTYEPTEYIYIDESQLQVDNTYYYWVENRDAAGMTETYGPISLTIPDNNGESPDAPIIEGSIRNYPNPFYPTTEISFMMNEPGQVEVTIFNSKGQMVTTLFNGYYDEETFNVAWNGRDNSGKEVTSGVYMYVIKTDSGTYSRKMVITK
ncbi:MAG TPA: T9SS type A sorting domain-containing protein [Candidatus Cloacimonetes bacterium]|nr:T9SS type A sorting domain-containing protein [Candidatus Cloacimonadota bacterium]